MSHERTKEACRRSVQVDGFTNIPAKGDERDDAITIALADWLAHKLPNWLPNGLPNWPADWPPTHHFW